MTERPGNRMLDFRSGGWVLLLATVIAVAGFAWRLAPLVRKDRVPPVGDGVHVESYGFVLEPLLVPRSGIAAGGLAKDGLSALVDPSVLSPDASDAWNAEHRGKYLVPSDRVIGVSLGGEARAYPLRVLNWHEIANDTLGGEPVAVTWSPLSGAAVVFSRRLGGEVLEFGVSGLLYDSNLLMYDRRRDAGSESLWCQLMARSVAGPRAAEGSVLERLPFSLLTWEEWRARHPETTVVAPDPGETERYARDVYGTYDNSDRLRFPVDPLPPADTLPLKTPVVVSGPPGDRVVRPADGAEDALVRAFWFAWYATHAEDPGRIVSVGP